MNNQDYVLELSQNPSKEEILLHSMQLWLHSVRAIGIEKIGTPKKLSLKLKNKNNEIIGGVYAKIQMDTMMIESVWILPEYKKKGGGKLMLERLYFEANKINIRCMLAFCYDFHESLGFLVKNDPQVEIAATIESSPGSHKLYLLKRSFS